MILPFLGCALFVSAILWLCFRMERERMFRQGWEARGHDAGAHTIRERRETK
jgi:hypothetical protein